MTLVPADSPLGSPLVSSDSSSSASAVPGRAAAPAAVPAGVDRVPFTPLYTPPGSVPRPRTVDLPAPHYGARPPADALGGGKFGVVVVSKLHDGDRVTAVAVKMASRSGLGVAAGGREDPADVALAREQRMASRLCHARVMAPAGTDTTGAAFILQPLGFAVASDGARALVMPLRARGDLEQWLRDTPGDTAPMIRQRLARELGMAVAYLHRNGIIHRDIKPANCLLTDDMRMKLADFGAAVSCSREFPHKPWFPWPTDSREVEGTPDTLCPPYILALRTYDADARHRIVETTEADAVDGYSELAVAAHTLWGRPVLLTQRARPVPFPERLPVTDTDDLDRLQGLVGSFAPSWPELAERMERMGYKKGDWPVPVLAAYGRAMAAPAAAAAARADSDGSLA